MREEGDFIDQFAHLSFYDENNPVREWMEYGRFNQDPVLDEDDDDSDIPLPSQIVRDHTHPSDLRQATGAEGISDWARTHVGNTHLGKKKLLKRPRKGGSKRQRGKTVQKSVASDIKTGDGDEAERSPPYQESHDSSSADDGDGDGDGGGGADGGGGSLHFTGINCTYVHTFLSDYEY
jgi:hypothetical protein